MTKYEAEMRLHELRKLEQEAAKYRKQGDWARLLIVVGKINRMKEAVEKVTLKSIIRDMNEKDRTNMSITLNEIILLTDMLEGRMVDFKCMLHNVAPSLVSVDICEKLSSALKDVRSVAGITAKQRNKDYYDDFCEISDKVSDYMRKKTKEVIKKHIQAKITEAEVKVENE